MFSNPFSPLQVTDVRANRTCTLKGKLEKLGRFFETPLDDLENREIERKKLIKEFSSTDMTGLVAIVTRTNLTDPKDLAKIDQIMNDAWEVDYFLLFFVAMKLEQEPLVARIKQFFEDQFVTLAPSTTAHILDRSFLNENLEKFEALPKRYRDYLIDLFLKIKVPGHYDYMDTEQPGPSTSSDGNQLVTNPTKKMERLHSSTLPQIFHDINGMEILDGEHRDLAVDNMLKNCTPCKDEESILKIICSNNEDTLASKLGPDAKGCYNELILLWIVTHPKYGAVLGEKRKEQLKKQLRHYFNKQFAYMVPESSSLCFINRIYYVENRLAIESLPEEAQNFIQNCFLTAPTRGHEGHVEAYRYSSPFWLNKKLTSPIKNSPKPALQEDAVPPNSWDFRNL